MDKARRIIIQEQPNGLYTLDRDGKVELGLTAQAVVWAVTRSLSLFGENRNPS